MCLYIFDLNKRTYLEVLLFKSNTYRQIELFFVICLNLKRYLNGFITILLAHGQNGCIQYFAWKKWQMYKIRTGMFGVNLSSFMIMMKILSTPPNKKNN